MKKHYFDACQLKGKIDPIDFYTRDGQEIGKGGTWKQAGLCPFHEDRNAGSFYINASSGGYKCFSCGAKGGDIIAFIQQKYALSFKDALCKLQSDWRVV